MTTTTIFPAVDGFLEATYADTEAWATVDDDTAANGAPNTTADNSPVGNGWTTGIYQNVQVFFSFDTSAIDGVPTSGQFKALLATDDAVNTKNPVGLGLYAYDWGANLTTGDYRGSASLSGPKATFSIADGTSATMLSANLADVSHIQREGFTRYVFASTSQATDPQTASESVRAGIALSEWSGTTDDPQLVIESSPWILADGTWDDDGVWDDAATWPTTVIAMDAGTLALDGLAATITRSVSVAMDAGSLALAGQDATVTYAPWLLADGVWNDNGVWNDAATWNDGGAVTIAADAGTIALAGLDASITRHIPVAMDAGAIALTGQDATVTVSVVIAMDAGTLALDGRDAGITRALLLAMDAGSLALSGADAAVTRALRVEMDAGALALAGLDAEIATAGFIPMEAGTLALAGNDLTITRSLILGMDAGTVALAGQDATIARSLTVSMGAGSLALDGNDITVSVGRMVAMDTGEVALVGLDATLTKSALIHMDAGTFALTGLDFVIGLVATDTPSLRTLSSAAEVRSLRSGTQGRSLP